MGACMIVTAETEERGNMIDALPTRTNREQAVRRRYVRTAHGAGPIKGRSRVLSVPKAVEELEGLTTSGSLLRGS